MNVERAGYPFSFGRVGAHWHIKPTYKQKSQNKPMDHISKLNDRKSKIFRGPGPYFLIFDDTPASSPVSTSVNTPVSTPVSTPVNTPVSIPVNTPVNTPVATPVSAPVTTPVNTPVNTPVSTPVNTCVGAPVNTSVSTPVRTQRSPTPLPRTSLSLAEWSYRYEHIFVYG